MNIATKTTLWRFLRILLFGAFASGVAWLLANVGLFIPNGYEWLIPGITAALSAIDKYIREKKKE
ncbi:MAG: hypothetical protein WC748_09925 [Legionellales bacterium]|jgi:hypothetical protein